MTFRPILTAFLVSTVFAVPAQQITNGTFEAWSDITAYDNPDDWSHGNDQIPGIATTTKVLGIVGQFAAHLETVPVGADTTFGFILHGNFVNNLATEGVPFTTAIDAIKGWYRYDLMPGDSAMIYLLAWGGGAVLDTTVQLIGGTQANWTAFSIPVNGGVPIVPDSVVMAVTSSNPFVLTGMAAGSWIEVDDLQLTSTSVLTPDLLPNNGMEDWTEVTTEEPDGWTTFNPLLVQLGLAPITKSTMAHGGSFSIRMETIDLGADTLPGIITNGDLFGAGLFSGVPYSDTPSLMTAFYQYAPVGADTAGIAALFIKNGSLLAQAYLQITTNAPNWTFIGTPITLFQSPDTLVLQIYSGSNPGSVLYVDDLAFSGISMGVRTNATNSVRSWPQPAADILNVVLDNRTITASSLRILDQMGRVVREEGVFIDAAYGLVLQVAELPAGQYVLELRSTSAVERVAFTKG